MSKEKRKPIPKRIRFEVFKRDKFTCQYCGRMSPEVILEIDHIKPVSKGGTNDIMNLITSCFDCNSGKSNIELSDDIAVKKQQAQLQEIAERREQIEMMLKWRESLKAVDEDCVDAVETALKSAGAVGNLTDFGRKSFKRLIKKYSLEEVLDAVDIAIDSYFDGSSESASLAISKIPGICYLRNKGDSDKNKRYYANYTLKAFRNKCFIYYDDHAVRRYIDENVHTEKDFMILKKVIAEARNWTKFKELAMENLGGKF